jgi:hypothetical protein
MVIGYLPSNWVLFQFILVKPFYEHAEICQYHREMIEKSDKEFLNELTLFQSALEDEDAIWLEDEDAIWLESNVRAKNRPIELSIFGTRGKIDFHKQKRLFTIISGPSGFPVLLNNCEIHTIKFKTFPKLEEKAAVLLFIDLHSIIKSCGGDLIKQSIIKDKDSALSLIWEVSANYGQIKDIRYKLERSGKITSLRISRSLQD